MGVDQSANRGADRNADIERHGIERRGQIQRSRMRLRGNIHIQHLRGGILQIHEHAKHHQQQRTIHRHPMRYDQRCHKHGVRAVDRTNMRQRFHSPATVGKLAAIQVAPQAGRAENHQADA